MTLTNRARRRVWTEERAVYRDSVVAAFALGSDCRAWPAGREGGAREGKACLDWRLRAHADGSPPAACSRCGVRGGMVDCGAQVVVEGSTITVHLCDTHCLAGDGGFALHWAVSMRTRGLTTSCSYVL